MTKTTEEDRAKAKAFSKKVLEMLVDGLQERGLNITKVQDADARVKDSKPGVISRQGFFITKGEQPAKKKEENDASI